MIALLFLLQDLSSPEKTLAAYIEAREKFAGAATLLSEIDRITAEVEAPFATDDLKKRRAAQLAQSRAMEKDARPQVLGHRIVERREDTLVVEEQLKAGPRTKKLAFQKAGDRWLIAREFDACTPCAGAGTCFWCRGAGEVNRKECPRCKGKKTCDACAGSKWQERSFDRGLGPIGTLVGFKPRSDLSTARGAAEAAADAQVELAVRISAALRKVFEQGQELLRKYFVAGVAAAADAALKRAVEEGDRALAAHAVRIERIDEIGDAATAVVTAPPGPLGGAGHKRVALKKIGGRWLVDDVQIGCPACLATGVCAACKGKKGAAQCIYCQNTGKCRECRGAGFAK